jgi:hypothetical protein
LSEDWHAIAAEVDEAIRSIGETDDGFPCALRVPPNGAPANPWDAPTGSPTYHTVYVVDDRHQLRDINGTLIGITRRTLTVSATGAVPLKSHTVAIGIKAEAATENSAWQEIVEVRPLAPAGIAVLYEIDLAA